MGAEGLEDSLIVAGGFMVFLFIILQIIRLIVGNLVNLLGSGSKKASSTHDYEY